MFMTLSGRTSQSNLRGMNARHPFSATSSPLHRASHALLPAHHNASSTGDSQLVIELAGKTWAHNTIQLSIQLFEADNELDDPTLTDLFAQLCLRCFQRPRLLNSDIYSVVLQHPTSLFDDLDLPHLTTLTVQLTLRHVDDGSDVSDAPAFAPLQLLLHGKHWPIRTPLSWDMAIDDSESENDDPAASVRDTSPEDPFMDSMEEHHDTTDLAPLPTDGNSLPSSPPAHQAITTASSPSPPSSPPVASPRSTSNPVAELKRPLSTGKKIVVPHKDPAQVTDAYSYFDVLLHSTDWKVTQQPDASNGQATVRHMDVDGHPTGATLCESVWPHCSIWDAKAVIVCAEAREIWDTMFDKGDFIGSITSSCSIWHHKLKAAWPASPRDYVIFASEYNSPHRVDLCATSCPDQDFYEHYDLPKTTSDFVRASLAIAGWRLDRVDPNAASPGKKPSMSVYVRFALQTNFQGWIPWYLVNQLATQAPNVPTSAYQYFKKYGAPPVLESLAYATLHQISYDHTRKHWRCEYTRAIESELSTQPSRSMIRLDRRRWAALASDPYANVYNITIDPPPSTVVAEFRKEEDPYGVWLSIDHLEQAIIPRRANILVLIKPQQQQQQQQQRQRQRSAASVSSLPSNPSPTSSSTPGPVQKKRHRTVTLLINGDVATIQDAAAMDDTLIDEELTTAGATGSSLSLQAPTPSPSSTSAPKKQSTPDDPAKEVPTLDECLQQLLVTPMDQAMAAFSFMKRMDEELFGWTMLSDKHGLRISKRPGIKASLIKKPSIGKKPSLTLDTINERTSTPSSPVLSASVITSPGQKPSKLLAAAAAAAAASNASSSPSNKKFDRSLDAYLEVPDPYMVYKSTKVIENFSVAEVASVVTNISTSRLAYDNSIESCERLAPMERGCQVVRQEIKSMFPFKSRELFLASCTAVENLSSGSSAKRYLYVESSVDMPSKLPSQITKAPLLARGRLFISGWILEPIDPYTTTTNHPIPSMRATYILALDLGPSIPSYVSNMIANGIASKKILWIEQFLNANGPLSYLVHPLPAIGLRRNQAVDLETLDDLGPNGTLNNAALAALGDEALQDNATSESPLVSRAMLFSPRTSLKWCQVLQTADGGQDPSQPLFVAECQCQYQPPKPMNVRAPTSTSVVDSPVQPTLSHSASWMDRRSSSSIYSNSNSVPTYYTQRRGSLPSPASNSLHPFNRLQTQHGITSSPPSATSSTTSAATPSSPAARRRASLAPVNPPVDPVLCELVVELQAFPRGYNVQVQFTTCRQIKQASNTLDLSGMLAVVVSELAPSPSQLLLASKEQQQQKKGAKPSTRPLPGKKHRIQVKLLASTLSQTVFQPQDNEEYTLLVTLKHYQAATQQQSFQQRQPQLTMSGIFGEDDEGEPAAKLDDNDWCAYVDGQRVTLYDQDIKLSSKSLELLNHGLLSTSSSSTTTSAEPSHASTPVPTLSDKSLMATPPSEAVITERSSLHQHSRQSSASSISSFASSSLGSQHENDDIQPNSDDTHRAMNLTKILSPFFIPFMMQKSDLTSPTSANDTNEKDSGDSLRISREASLSSISAFATSTAMPRSTANTASASSSDTPMSPILPCLVIRRRWIFIWCILFVLSALSVTALLLLKPQLIQLDLTRPIYSLCRLPWFGGWEVQLILNRAAH
ncbi:hypothetical protein DM01DRAFT_1382012 [Hesseltinella vesiculosa]|uniref:START domain-containing protein n=1 Tax=Hesseltinella vesiculosa TaxID=101127 RepID=A0A1X2GP64_9FUNG|nr:hypothetical protein DM01DRAFT_1382012 [Hesseltinella vesiculosa]